LTLQITPQVFQITIRATNLYVIVEDRLTLIDTGFRGSMRKIAEFASSIGRDLREIDLAIITHNHLDHIGSLAELRELTDVKAAIHRIDVENTENELPYPGGKRINKLLNIPALSNLREHLVIDAEDANILLDDGSLLPVLGGLQVIHTPGHTAGSISLYSERDKVLFVGDALQKHYGRPCPPSKMVSSDLEVALDSMEKMAQLDCNIICFGHGKPIMKNGQKMLQDLVAKQRSDTTIKGYISSF